eukprot:6191953-Pleurochrysis_carterae.AAC.1
MCSRDACTTAADIPTPQVVPWDMLAIANSLQPKAPLLAVSVLVRFEPRPVTVAACDGGRLRDASPPAAAPQLAAGSRTSDEEMRASNLKQNAIDGLVAR